MLLIGPNAGSAVCVRQPRVFLVLLRSGRGTVEVRSLRTSRPREHDLYYQHHAVEMARRPMFAGTEEGGSLPTMTGYSEPGRGHPSMPRRSSVGRRIVRGIRRRGHSPGMLLARDGEVDLGNRWSVSLLRP